MADISKELNQIKNAVYGREVRGSIHDGIDKVNRESEGSRQIANNTEQRQDAVEQQFNTLLGEWSDDKPIDNAETIAARTNTKESKTYENLGKRLDEEYGKVTSQLAETEQALQFKNNAPLPIPIPTYEGSGQTVHPDALYFPNRWNGYRYWMVHTPYPNTDDKYENPSIAVSNDGITWVDVPGLTNPIDQPTEEELSQNVHLSDGVIFIVGNTMECWYRYRNKTTNEEKFLRRTTTDGVNWTPKEVVYQFTVDTSHTWGVSPSLIYEDNKYRMWYVNGTSIWYVESAVGKTGTWSEPIRINDRWIGDRIEPWHIDITRDPKSGKLNLIITTLPVGIDDRYIAWGTSDNGILFENTKVIMSPSLGKAGWDNKSLYRASLVYVDDVYRLYYSAMNVNNQWKIGLVEGLAIDRMSGVLPINQDGVLLIDSAQIYNLRIRSNQILLDNVKAYFKNDELQFHEKGVAAAKIVLEDDNSLSIRRENGDYTKLTLGELITTALTMNSIRSRSGEPIVVYNDFVFRGSADDPLFIKLLDFGRADTGMRVGRPHALQVTDGSGERPSFLELSGLVIENSVRQPPAVKGAIRFNYDTNKHEGHDGTKWNPLY